VNTARPGLGCLVLAVAMLVLGLSQAEVAYRLTFQNGTGLEVQSYEDLGDGIRHQRYGGTVVVPRANVSAIGEAVHLPPPTPPAAASRAPSAAPSNITQGIHSGDLPTARQSPRARAKHACQPDWSAHVTMGHRSGLLP
jgi:hypothetical protein